MKHVAFKAGLRADLLVSQNRRERCTATIRHTQRQEMHDSRGDIKLR
jgi:hypothetical protein